MVDDRQQSRPPRAGGVLLSSVAAVSWSLLGMAGVAALGLHLLGADAAGRLGPLTAAAVALGVGGKVVPAGDVEIFGLEGAKAEAAIDIVPLGVSLVGALLLAYVFLRSLRSAGMIGAGQLAARVGTVVALYTAALGGLAWAGSSTVTINGDSLGLDRATGGAEDALRDRFGDGLGDIGGGLLDRADQFADAKVEVGFRVEAAPTLVAGALFALVVLLIALAASRRTPLPPGRFGDVLHRGLRPAASALVAMLLTAVAAALAAAVYGALAGGDPERVAGGALLGAPNGAWLAVPLGLMVAWRGSVTGQLGGLLPDPVGELLGGGGEKTLGVSELAALDSRVWLLPVAVGLMLLTAGILTAARTPRRGAGAGRFALRCALWLGLATGVALPLLVALTGVSADAGLSVMGIDAVGAGVELHGSTAGAAGLGLLWGAAAGLIGGLLACATGAAGRRAAPLATGGRGPRGTDGAYDSGRTYPDIAYEPGPYRAPPRPSPEEPNPYKQGPYGQDPHGYGPAPGGRGPGGPGGGPGGGRGGPGSPHAAPTVTGGPLPRPRRRETPPPAPPPGPQGPEHGGRDRRRPR